MSIQLIYSKEGKTSYFLLEEVKGKECSCFQIKKIPLHHTVSNREFTARIIQAEETATALLEAVQKIVTITDSERDCEPEFSGSVLVAREGRILFQKDYGRAASKKGELVYRWGSISKTITAVAILQLVEAGEIELDRPITDYLEEYRDAEKYPGLVNVTVGELLAHRSKMPDHQDYLETVQAPPTILNSQELRKFKREIEEEYFLKHQTPQEMMEHIATLPLKKRPHNYNNFAFTLLGLLVERKGHSYPDFVQKNIFVPAGMVSAQIAMSRESDAPTAEGFSLEEGNELTPVDDPMVRFASGNINGSTSDLYRFDRALKEGVLLDGSLLKRMQEERFGFDPLVLAPPEVAGKEMVAKSGVMAGVRTVYQYFPEEDTTIILLGNTDLDVCSIGESMAHLLFHASDDLTRNSSQNALRISMDYLLERIHDEPEEGIAEVAEILENDPEFVPYAFDIAMQLEESGDKESADQIRRLAIAIIPTGPASPAMDDPHFLTPPLTGKYRVGIKSFYLEDRDRNERELGHPVDRTRRLEIQVHYPAIQNREPAFRVDPNVENLVHPDAVKKKKFNDLWTRSQPGLEPYSDKQFPILLFSPGWGQNPSEYQQLLEDVASHGFYVISINHPFSNFGTAYLGHSQDQRHQEAFEQLDAIAQKEIIEKESLINARDMEFVLLQIKTGQIEGFNAAFGGCFDEDSIGVVGHSMGGAAALQTCRNLPSLVKAGINIDGGLNSSETIAQPFLIIGAGGALMHRAIAESRREWEHFLQRHPLSQRVDIPHATHEDFTLLPLFRSIGAGMPIEEKKFQKTEAHLHNLRRRRRVAKRSQKSSLNVQIQAQEEHLRGLQKNERFHEISRRTSQEIVAFFTQHLKL
jgi:CubicO group peptidase (beta-lactamase class C family)/pimeloyl-ACP methyl ester carboxylesterase